MPSQGLRSHPTLPAHRSTPAVGSGSWALSRGCPLGSCGETDPFPSVPAESVDRPPPRLSLEAAEHAVYLSLPVLRCLQLHPPRGNPCGHAQQNSERGWVGCWWAADHGLPQPSDVSSCVHRLWAPSCLVRVSRPLPFLHPAHTDAALRTCACPRWGPARCTSTPLSTPPGALLGPGTPPHHLAEAQRLRRRAGGLLRVVTNFEVDHCAQQQHPRRVCRPQQQAVRTLAEAPAPTLHLQHLHLHLPASLSRGLPPPTPHTSHVCPGCTSGPRTSQQRPTPTQQQPVAVALPARHVLDHLQRGGGGRRQR